MLQLKHVQREIEDALRIDRSDLTSRQISSLQARVRELNLIRDYLKKEPTEEFIEKEVNRIYTRLRAIDADFMYWTPPPGTKINPRKEYEKELGVPKLKQQLSFLQGLLQDTL